MKRAILFYMSIILLLVLAFFLVLVAVVFFRPPSNDRDWSEDQATLANADIGEDQATVHNIRNSTYTTKDDYTTAYSDKTFDLSKIVSIDYVVAPFSGRRGPAHTQLSFGFETDEGSREYLAISVEIRKERGESFSAVKGLFRQFELMYVVASEDDIVKLRTNYRKNDVYMYPVKTTKEKMKKMFVSMLERVNSLYERPEFYNPITNSCATNIAKHANIVTPKRIPRSYKVILPGYSDELAYDLELIDTDVPLEKLREEHFVTSAAQAIKEGEDFSKVIRESIGIYK